MIQFFLNFTFFSRNFLFYSALDARIFKNIFSIEKNFPNLVCLSLQGFITYSYILKKNTEEEAIKYIRAHFCMMGQLQKVREWKHKSPCINIKEICSQSLANKVGIFHILKYSKDDIKWDPSAKNQRPQVHAASRKLVQV